MELLLKRIRESLADQELTMNLSDEAADMLVDKGWDPAMGARPLRRAIQRYIEDPLADQVLAQSMAPGSTVEVEKATVKGEDGEDEDGVKVTVHKPARKREAVGVGAEGVPDEAPEGGDNAPEDSTELPEPDVLPDVPDAPPAPEDEGK